MLYLELKSDIKRFRGEDNNEADVTGPLLLCVFECLFCSTHPPTTLQGLSIISR